MCAFVIVSQHTCQQCFEHERDCSKTCRHTPHAHQPIQDDSQQPHQAASGLAVPLIHQQPANSFCFRGSQLADAISRRISRRSARRANITHKLHNTAIWPVKQLMNPHGRRQQGYHRRTHECYFRCCVPELSTSQQLIQTKEPHKSAQ